MSNEPQNTVLRRLRAYISTMAPHQRERAAGRLLIEAAAEIERLLSVCESVKQKLDVNSPLASDDRAAWCKKWHGLKAAIEEAIGP